jgi:flagellar hook-associated protein 1 FlgK
MDYQKTLTETLNFRYTSLTGVNLDEEVSQLMVYQQAYSAAAKVISTTQQMFEILNNILR